jgi:hypothetical protein
MSAPAVTESWIYRCNTSEIPGPGFSAGFEMAVLAIHAIGNMTNRSPGPQILGCITDEFFSITDKFSVFIQGNCIGIRCRPQDFPGRLNGRL